MAVILVATSVLTSSASALTLTEPEVVTLEINDTPISTERGVRLPVENAKITQGYNFIHSGIDMDGVTGDPVYPVMSGRVERVDRSGFWYGNSVLVDHGNGFKSFYAHLERVKVRPGQEVSLTTQIGEVGATGRAFGDHLHFEVYRDGRTLNPYSILPRGK